MMFVRIVLPFFNIHHSSHLVVKFLSWCNGCVLTVVNHLSLLVSSGISVFVCVCSYEYVHTTINCLFE